MAIYALGDQVPNIHETAFVHPDAVIIGSVEIGAESTIWPGAVLRGDDGYIKIGARTSIQDNTVIHTTPQDPTIVGDDCVIGHIVHLECCIIEDGAQVSSGAVVLHRVRVGTGAIVAANAVVLNDQICGKRQVVQELNAQNFRLVANPVRLATVKHRIR